MSARSKACLPPRALPLDASAKLLQMLTFYVIQTSQNSAKVANLAKAASLLMPYQLSRRVLPTF